MKAHGINPTAAPEVIAEGASWAAVDGPSCMGMLSCTLAMTKAIEKGERSDYRRRWIRKWK